MQPNDRLALMKECTQILNQRTVTPGPLDKKDSVRKSVKNQPDEVNVSTHTQRKKKSIHNHNNSKSKKRLSMSSRPHAGSPSITTGMEPVHSHCHGKARYLEEEKADEEVIFIANIEHEDRFVRSARKSPKKKRSRSPRRSSRKQSPKATLVHQNDTMELDEENAAGARGSGHESPRLLNIEIMPED